MCPGVGASAPWCHPQQPTSEDSRGFPHLRRLQPCLTMHDSGGNSIMFFRPAAPTTAPPETAAAEAHVHSIASLSPCRDCAAVPRLLRSRCRQASAHRRPASPCARLWRRWHHATQARLLGENPSLRSQHQSHGSQSWLRPSGRSRTCCTTHTCTSRSGRTWTLKLLCRAGLEACHCPAEPPSTCTDWE